MEELDVYVLGAGASYVHGAPLTNQILQYALTQTGLDKDARLELVKEFLRNVFHFDSDTLGHKWQDYPNLVDVLSVVDMALDRRENLARKYDQEQLRKVRKALEYTIFRALEHSLAYGTRNDRRRSTATWQLVKKLDPASSAIISFNYDVIVDIALSRRFKNDFKFEGANAESLGETEEPLGIDYGVEFANMTITSPSRNLFKLWKLHGSFNWLWSPVTGRLYYGGLNKAISVVFDEQSDRAADLFRFYENQYNPFAEDTRVLEPIMITPTQLKDLRNPHLTQLWRKTEEDLRNAKTITFIGYSLPGDDLHIKYLFKRAIETRFLENEPKITVVDYDEGTHVTTVQQNYQQFFGNDVDYYRYGFDRFVRERT